MAKEKAVTTNELARMVQRGFEAVDERFDGVDRRFEAVDKRFDKVEARLDRIENILLRGYDNRLERLEDFMLEAKKVLKIK
jgi:DNA anti-recombination protein RmuC